MQTASFSVVIKDLNTLKKVTCSVVTTPAQIGLRTILVSLNKNNFPD